VELDHALEMNLLSTEPRLLKFDLRKDKVVIFGQRMKSRRDPYQMREGRSYSRTSSLVSFHFRFT